MSSINQKSIRNSILAALPAEEFALLADSLVRVELHLGETLHLAGAEVEHVHFPEIGLISAMAVLADGSPLEIGLIGAEGAAGVSIILGAKKSYSEKMCQTPGAAHRISSVAFTRAVGHAPHLREMLLKYVHAFHVQVAQTAACNAHREVSQRLARRLLAAHDRSGVPELSLTQDPIPLCDARWILPRALNLSAPDRAPFRPVAEPRQAKVLPPVSAREKTERLPSRRRPAGSWWYANGVLTS